MSQRAAMIRKAKSNLRVFTITKRLLVSVLYFYIKVHAENFPFTNSISLAALAEKQRDIPAALNIYGAAEQFESSNVVNLCVLTRRYCDLTYLTNSITIQKTVMERALACALRAVKADPENATAHASLAVCYAKSCTKCDLKTELTYSRLFKFEAEKTIALDPNQDIAYYLLGRWNYGIANIGLLSRAFVKIIYGGLPKASNEAAIENFNKAIELAPNRIISHAGLAMTYEATGQRKLEIVELKKCRDLKPIDREDIEAQADAEQKLAALRQ